MSQKLKAPIQKPLFIPGSLLMIAGVVCLSVLTSLLNSKSVLSAAETTPFITPAFDRLAEPTQPANPSQADLGAVAYWLSCMVCHGDRGQGLTEEWRAVAGQEDMNCWQSRCHASNHPPEGFVLPAYAPSIIGTGSLSRFNTAADLHTFILERMPWQAPGVLNEETYWQLTAFLLRANDLNLGSEPLSPQNAAQVHLREGVAGEFSVVGSETSPEDDIVATTDNRFEVDRIWLGLIGIALAMLLLIGAVGLSFNRARRESHNPTEDQNKTE